MPLTTVLVFLPLAAAALAWLIPSDRVRPLVLPVAAAAHLVISFFLIRNLGSLKAGEWVQLDALGAVVLAVVSVLFAVCAAYAPAYLALRIDRGNRVFCSCFLVLLAMMSLVVLAQHLGLLWVAVEATTLSTAPLVYFNRNARSLEATWKYLMIGSVGIALALLGSLFVSYAAYLGAGEPSLVFSALLQNAGGFSRPWLRAAFVLLLVGYGTKMGLAPLHTWKPDVYGEAPGIVGALLAGGTTSCAFLALLRVYRIVDAAGEGAFARELLVGMGLLSIAFAAVFMVRQRDFKRMLAYSSVEHMGILALGVGLGGPGLFGAILHTVNNGITKGVLFLAAGNIHRAFGSKSSEDVSGAIARLPVSGSLFLAGFFAITGSPPFGPFVSEFTILNAAIGSGRYVVATLYLVLLFVVFIGMGATVLSIVQGRPSGAAVASSFRDSASKTLPIVASMAIVLLLGLWIPEPLRRLLNDAAAGLGARP
jgi:hydrogenase-4 component F